MPDDPAFIRRIAADPDDDAPRLVYADYLDETGDPVKAARAEFIRVQVERARLVPDTPRSRELWYRDAALLDWARQWRAELPVIAGVQYGGFIRGFIDRVEVQPPRTTVETIGTGRRRRHWPIHDRSDFLDRAAEVFDAIPVRKLVLTNIAVDGAERLVDLDGFNQLVELNVFGPNVTPRLFEALVARGPWSNLRRLRVSSPEPWPADHPSDILQRLAQVFHGQLDHS